MLKSGSHQGTKTTVGWTEGTISALSKLVEWGPTTPRVPPGQRRMVFLSLYKGVNPIKEQDPLTSSGSELHPIWLWTAELKSPTCSEWIHTRVCFGRTFLWEQWGHSWVFLADIGNKGFWLIGSSWHPYDLDTENLVQSLTNMLAYKLEQILYFWLKYNYDFDDWQETLFLFLQILYSLLLWFS